MTGPLILGDKPLTPSDVVAVARGRQVVLGEAAVARMKASRAVLDSILARGEEVYGLTTGVGAIKTVRVTADQQQAFQVLLLRAHQVGRGPLAPPDVVRAAMLIRAAGLAAGVAGVRPELADAFCRALDAPVTPRVHHIGSTGQAGLSQMAEIGLALTGHGLDGAALVAAGFEPVTLAPREAHAIVNGNAFSVGTAFLGLDAARRALGALDLSAALSLEGLTGNVGACHPAVAAVRPDDGAGATIERGRGLLSGGPCCPGRARPLAAGPAVLQGGPAGARRGAAGDLAGGAGARGRAGVVRRQPYRVVESDRAISTGNHEIAPAAIAVDYARLGLAQAVTIAGERVMKLLGSSCTGLATGLRADRDAPDDGLAILANGAASLAGEARLLASPVTLEQPPSGIAPGSRTGSRWLPRARGGCLRCRRWPSGSPRRNSYAPRRPSTCVVLREPWAPGPGWPTPRSVVRSLSPARDRPATVTLTNWADGSAATPRREP